MDSIQTLPIFLVGFLIISLAAKQIGGFFSGIKLPKITGYLVTGLIAGKFVLGFMPPEAVSQLHFIDNISLAFIAFAAGNELFVPELKGRFKSIGWVTAGLVIATYGMVSISVFLLADYIPFMDGMPVMGLIAVSILAGSILVARSPSSAIAIVNELRAKGPFTQVILGVTVISDVVVIALFAFSASAADALLAGVSISLGFAVLLLGELLLALLAAGAVYFILLRILAVHVSHTLKVILILLTGWGVFGVSGLVREFTHANLPVEILIEPLMVCMVAGFLVTNYGKQRTEFDHLLHDAGPIIYIAFFTLTGASLKLDVMLTVWPIALALFVIRVVSIFIGSFAGGVIAGVPMRFNRLKWMGLITQAGVALGLAKEVASEFPEFGESFATMIVAVVVLNELVGPILIKYAINRVGEAHSRGEPAPFDGVRDAVIFGLRAQAVTLARQLQRHGWQVKLVCKSKRRLQELATPDVNIHLIEDLSLEAMRELGVEHADAIISFLSDDESYQVCETAYENFGTETMVVRLKDRANFGRFHELGVLVVEPRTAVSSLLEHFVLAPAATSMLLGMDEEQEVVDVEVCNPILKGMALRDMRLPLDVLVLSIHRGGHTLVPRGHTELNVNDKVTMVGPREKLEEVMLRFGS